MPNIPVTVRMSHPATSSGERYAVLEIQDAANRHTIVEVTLNPDMFHQMLSGLVTGDTAPAEVMEPAAYAHLGARTHVWSRTLYWPHPESQLYYDHELTTKRRSELGAAQSIYEVEWLTTWAESLRAQLWAHEVTLTRLRSNKVAATFRRYSNDLTPDMANRIEEMVRTAPAPKGMK